MKQSSDLTPEFNNAVAGAAKSDESMSVEPVTKQRSEELKSQLSEPRLVLELTPAGPVTTQVRTENDQRIMAELDYIRNRLDSRRNQARDGFNMSHDGPRGEHLRPRLKM